VLLSAAIVPDPKENFGAPPMPGVHCVEQQRHPLYVANCSVNKHFLLNSEENGEPLASLGE
jgi:hypothetical protein